MQKYIVRHGLSQANNHENFGTPAFGSAGAELMPEGWAHARHAGKVLVSNYHFDPITTHVATSHMRRTQQTALGAGFAPENMTAYSLLDEVTSGLSFDQIANAILLEIPPPSAIAQVEALLDNPPEEPIWFTHGLVIASICYIRGITTTRFIPRFGEVRKINIG